MRYFTSDLSLVFKPYLTHIWPVQSWSEWKPFANQSVLILLLASYIHIPYQLVWERLTVKFNLVVLSYGNEVSLIFGSWDQETDLWFTNHEPLIPTLKLILLWEAVRNHLFSRPQQNNGLNYGVEKTWRHMSLSPSSNSIFFDIYPALIRKTTSL